MPARSASKRRSLAGAAGWQKTPLPARSASETCAGLVEQRHILAKDTLASPQRQQGKPSCAARYLACQDERMRGYAGSNPRRQRRDDGGEKRHQFRIQSAALGVLAQHLQAALVRDRLAIGTFAGQGIIHIGDGKDAYQRRNLLAVQTIGIALAVEPFVMRTNQRQRLPQRVQRFDDVCPLRGVTLDNLELRRR